MSAIDRDDLIARLTDQLEGLAELLFGPPNRSTLNRSEWRWGKKGSRSLVVRDGGGRRRGLFSDFEAGVSGSPLDMIRAGRSCGIAEAFEFGLSFLGLNGRSRLDPVPASVLQERAQKRAEKDREAAAALDQRVQDARKLWSEALPISGTVVERYLVETRCIPLPALGWPDCIRFHRKRRGLIAAATLATGEVQAVQLVYLNPDGRKISDEECGRRKLPAIKTTYGATNDAVVRLPCRRTEGTKAILLAEGPETGLSGWISTGHETWITCGGWRSVPLEAGRPIVVLRDDDKQHSPADNNLRKQLAGWRKEGHAVSVASPYEIRRFDKSDFNDLLQSHGVQAVVARIERMLRPQAAVIERQPIAVVRDRLNTAIGDFFAAADASDGGEESVMPVHAIKVDLGSGKSRTSYRYAVRMLAEMRSRGDNRSIAVAVPTHKLGDEQVANFLKICKELDVRLTARVWRGRKAIDPDGDDAKTTMCRNLEAVRDVQAIGADVFKSACQRELENGDKVNCAFKSLCGYERQRRTIVDLWIVPHELLFSRKPATIGNLAVLVVDECSRADGLEGVKDHPILFPVDDLRKPAPVLDGAEMVIRYDTDRLAFLRNALADALEDHADGPLVRDVMEDSNLTHDNAGEAYKIEWRRFVDPQINPGMDAKQRKEAAGRAKGNADIICLSKVWKAAQALLGPDGPQKSGWLSLATDHDNRDGTTARVLHVKGRKDIKTGWRVPTLLLDATLNPDLVRFYWPQVEVTADLMATAPHQHVRQVRDRAFSKSMLEPVDVEAAESDPILRRMLAADPDAPERRLRNLRKTHANISREARRYAPGRVLVVCQKAVKEALSSFGPLPANVELAHHNDVAGRDEWGPQPGRDGVRAIIVVGRTMPKLAAVQRLAEALTGAAVEDVPGGWYQRADAFREGLDGQAEAVETERHPDPVAEAIRWQICEGELLQIIGRGRGVNRTAANPLDVLVLTDAPIPVPVAETISAKDLDPSPDDMMAAAGGVVFRNPGQAAAAYPFLWSNREAAKKALARRLGTSLYVDIFFIEECPQPRFGTIHGGKVTFRVAGAGQKPATAWFDPAVIPNVKGWLEGRLGALAWCRIEPPEPPPVAVFMPAVPPTEDVPMHVAPIRPAMFYPPANPIRWEETHRPIVDFLTVKGPFGSFARHPAPLILARLRRADLGLPQDLDYQTDEVAM